MSCREIFRAEKLPVFQNKMFATAEAARSCPTGDIILVQDMDTGLVFNAAFDPSMLIYDSDYQNEQACSDVFQHHLQDVTRIVERHFSGKSLIEVGCGKGYFLNHLKHWGYDITGIDPAYEGENPDVIKACFKSDLGITGDGVILRHVLEHMVDPVGFLKDIADANAGHGLIYIEVPCFDWICRHRAWFDIFYEHVNYFRLSDFHRMFGKVAESGYVFGGQYLYVVADLSSLRVPRLEEGDAQDFPEGFLADITQHARYIAAHSEQQHAVWGGASKGVIFSLYMQRASVDVDMIIDINPAKQGKYAAASGYEIYSPERAFETLAPSSCVFVMNSNYIDEIVRQSQNLFRYIKVDYHEL